MGRQKIRQWDEERTILLGHDELLVQQGVGDSRNYVAWNHEIYCETCPECGSSNIKTQNLFSKNYIDCIWQNNRWRTVSLEYRFYKFRCQQTDCGHVFAKEISFASKRDNVTYRMGNEIAKAIIAGKSYRAVSNMFQGSVSPQAVGQIFNRWFYRTEAKRSWQDFPSSIAVLSGFLDSMECTIILNTEDGVRVFDVFAGIDSKIIGDFLQQGVHTVQTVYTDCNPIINDVVNDLFPNAVHVIPVEFWLEQVSFDFMDYFENALPTKPNRRMLNILTTPRPELGFRTQELDEYLEEYPEIQVPFEQFNHLYEMTSRKDESWVYPELVHWQESLPDDVKEALRYSILQLYHFQNEIGVSIDVRERIPPGLCLYFEALMGSIMSEHIFSAEALKAKLLYAIDSDLQHWSGIPIMDLIDLYFDDEEQRGNEEYEYERN